MRKCLAFIAALLCLVLFSSCSDRPNSIEIANQALVCFDNDDVEGLKLLFCDEIISNVDDFDKQIEDAFALYEGTSVSKGAITAPSEEKVRDGKTVKYNVDPYIPDILTDAGKKYEMIFFMQTANDEHPEYIGISEINIFIYDENGELELGKEIGALIP